MARDLPGHRRPRRRRREVRRPSAGKTAESQPSPPRSGWRRRPRKGRCSGGAPHHGLRITGTSLAPSRAKTFGKCIWDGCTRHAIKASTVGAAPSSAPPEEAWHRRCTHSGCGRELGPHQRRPAARDHLPLLGQSRDGRRARHRNAGLVLGPPPVSARPRQDRRSELAATTPSASSNTRRVSSMSASVCVTDT